MSFVATAYENLTVTGTAGGFTAATFGNCTSAIVYVETAQIRFRLDGTAPTASVGFIADPGAYITLSSQNELKHFQAIRTGSTNATLRCEFGTGLEGFGLPLISTTSLGAGESVVGLVGFKTVRARATLNSVSPGVIAAAGDYAAGDVLNDSTSAAHIWQVDLARANGYGGVITKVKATVSVAAMVPGLRLHMYNSSPTIFQNDNVAMLKDLDDRAADINPIDLPAFSTTGSSEYAEANLDTSVSFKCGASDTKLYFVVQTRDAFTNESASMTLDIHFTASQD